LLVRVYYNAMVKYRFPAVIPARDRKTGNRILLISLPAAARVLGVHPQSLWNHRHKFGGRRLQIGTAKRRLYFPAEELIKAAIPLRRDPITVGWRLADLLGVPRDEMTDKVVELLWGEPAEAITARVRESEMGSAREEP